MWILQNMPIVSWALRLGLSKSDETAKPQRLLCLETGSVIDCSYKTLSISYQGGGSEAIAAFETQEAAVEAFKKLAARLQSVTLSDILK
jgi:hypothetical protein